MPEVLDLHSNQHTTRNTEANSLCELGGDEMYGVSRRRTPQLGAVIVSREMVIVEGDVLVGSAIPKPSMVRSRAVSEKEDASSCRSIQPNTMGLMRTALASAADPSAKNEFVGEFLRDAGVQNNPIMMSEKSVVSDQDPGGFTRITGLSSDVRTDPLEGDAEGLELVCVDVKVSGSHDLLNELDCWAIEALRIAQQPDAELNRCFRRVPQLNLKCSNDHL